MHRTNESPHYLVKPFIALACALTLTGAAIAGSPVSNTEGRVPPALNAPSPEPTNGAIVQLALLLDTSSSMNGLIDQARAQLWSVVNEMSQMQQDCKPVQLQVALFQYGNDGLESADGFIQLRTPFTTDLDIISEQLFALQTNGGSEFCGQVIQQAADRLAWIKPIDDPGAPSVTRMIVIAGNEPFTQGTTPYQSAIPSATNKGVSVHTVFCGPKQEGINTFWKEGATLGEGRYCAIDHNQTIVEIDTPFDTVISKLNTELNTTYIRYGSKGAASMERQATQDSLNASSSKRSRARRANAKSTGLYNNRVWDLVDASAEDDFDLSSIDRETLPEEFQDLTEEELRAAIDKASESRTQIRRDIQTNFEARTRYLAEHQQEQASAGTLETVLLDTIKEALSDDPKGPESSEEHDD
jgi:hypothetical protein